MGTIKHILTGFLLFSLTVPTTVVSAADIAKIISKENAIRVECRFFSAIAKKVVYNDKVTILEKKGDWFIVQQAGTQGCIHKSAIEEESFSLAGLVGSGGETTSDEVAMAGKGFDPQVEKSFQTKHPEFDFKTIDRIEQFTVSDQELQTFIRQGGLKQP